MELGSYFLFLQEQIKDIIIIAGFKKNSPHLVQSTPPVLDTKVIRKTALP
jgi:hypothetical protein